jgi:hypothetical protein
MSIVKTNAVQVGQSVTTTNNFTLYQPNTPDGTVRLGVGNAGSVTDLAQFDSSGVFAFNSGYGSVATAYACRAWVNFNGSGTVSIRSSGNITSITDNGPGDYTVNFTTAMPDVNYAAFGHSGPTGAITGVSAYTTSSYRFTCINTAGTLTDPANVNVSIFR